MKNQTIRLFYLLLFFTAPVLLFIATNNTGVDTWVRFFPDDAFYYLQTAFNYSIIDKVTFDGTNTTTGFHPLFFLLCVGAANIFNKNEMLLFFVIFNSISLALSLWIIDLNIKRSMSELIVGAAILLLPLFTLHLFTSSGMESSLLIIFYSIFISYIYSIKERLAILRGQEMAAIGIAAGCLVLSRLDMVIALIPFAGWLIFNTSKNNIKSKLKLLIISLIFFLVVISVYLFWLKSMQNSLTPISSIAKYGRVRWPLVDVFRSLTSGTIAGGLLLAFYALLPSIVVLSPIFYSRIKVNSFIWIVSCSSLLYIIYVIFIAHEPYKWYLNFPAYSCYIIIFLYCNECGNCTSILRGYKSNLFALTSLLVSLLFITTWSKLETTAFSLYQLTEKINNRIPSNYSIATNDAGVIGYFSNSRVHNLDGLINSEKNWDDYLRNMDYLGYADKFQIKYFILTPSKYKEWRAKETRSIKNMSTFSPVEIFIVPRFGEEVLLKVN